MSEFQFFDGECLITFNIVELNEDKQEIYVAKIRTEFLGVILCCKKNNISCRFLLTFFDFCVTISIAGRRYRVFAVVSGQEELPP
jgi:hypothetical protein